MTKVSSFPQSIWHWFANHLISPIRHTFLIDLAANALHRLKEVGNRCSHRIKRQGLGIWLIAVTGASLLMIWNGLLLCALSVGLGTTLIIQRYRTDLTRSWQNASQWLTRPHSTSAISVGCGLLSLIASYITLLIWQETDSFGLALALLLQGLGLVAVLGLFISHLLKREKQQLTPSRLDSWTHNLTALDPLKRLIAVRQINHYLEVSSVDVARTQELKEYFQLLLKQEPEPSIQNAIVSGLELINDA